MQSNSFDQPVILRQSPVISRAILWVIVLVAGFGIAWASFAEVEEAVSALGKLEPEEEVEPVQAPIGGVIQAIYVREGQSVNAGQALLRFDQTAARAQLLSLVQIRRKLLQENQFYQAQMRGDSQSVTDMPAIAGIQLSPEMLSLTRNRAGLSAENRLYRLQLQQGDPSGLTAEEQQRFQSAATEQASRQAAARLEVSQLEQQLKQNQVMLGNAREMLRINQNILKDIEKPAQDGAIAKIQYLQQQQQVNTRAAELNRLIEEDGRLRLAITQAQQKLQNTTAITQQTQLKDIADNNKRIAEIDSQLTKAIVENDKRIAEINSQLSQIQVTLKYQVITAPIAGTIFDLKPAGPGFVANTSEPILKIVPSGKMVAKVFITNRDIGFVEPGMHVDVRLDSFPYSEFGDVKGRLLRIGSDALAPDQIYPFYRFPADIQLERQSLMIRNRPVNLQSGMSVTANIRTRKRTIMSMLTGLITEKIDKLKSSR